MNILFIETFYGGSHSHFTDSLISASGHHFDLITLPDRCWKWRIRSSVWEVVSQIQEKIKSDENIAGIDHWDLIIASEMIDLPFLKERLRAFCSKPGSNLPPIILYYHENYLTYPNPESRIDYQLGFSPVLNALTADFSWFNSEFHREAFALAAAEWVGRIPEFGPVPHEISGEILEKSSVIYPGIGDDFGGLDLSKKPEKEVKTILWNHRWEFDKKPESFFSLMKEMKEKGLPFKLILAGECSQLVPKPFLAAKESFKEEIIHYGFAPSREVYRKLCHSADITVSTSNQENFGISFIEAVLAGCRPLLPDRLSYPELIPDPFKPMVIYKNRKELSASLEALLKGDQPYEQTSLADALRHHCWSSRIAEYDEAIEGYKGSVR